MRISKQDFLQKVKELSLSNWKVRMLLDTKGSFDKLTEHQKHIIAKKLGIEYQKSIKITETFNKIYK